MADSSPKSYHTDPTLYLYTSLTSGSSHIITATSRLQTILKANRIEFSALDVATDEKARMLWGRRAGKRKLPGLVRFGMIVGDLEEVEEWNEYGELKENVAASAPTTKPSALDSSSTTNTPTKPQSSINAPSIPSSDKIKTSAEGSATQGSPLPMNTESKQPPSVVSAESTLTTAMRQAGFEAAKKAGDAKAKARAEALETSRLKSAELQKLDDSGPTGMPPPSGSTEAEEAKKPDDGETSVDGLADKVPAVKVEGEALTAGGENVPKDETLSAKAPTDSSPLTKADGPQPGDVAKVQNSTGTPSGAKSSKLESAGSPSTPNIDQQRIPSAKEAEAATLNAIIEDESQHVHIAGSPPGRASPGMKVTEDANIETRLENEEAEAKPRDTREASSEKAATVVSTDEIDPKHPRTAADVQNKFSHDESAPSSNREAGQPDQLAKMHEDRKPLPSANSAQTEPVQDLSVTRTQDQSAAVGEHAGESVAD